MLDVIGPYLATGHNVYRRVKVDGEQEFGIPEAEHIDAWVAQCADEYTARGLAEALNVRNACDWEFAARPDDDDGTKRAYMKRMSFATDWEDVSFNDLPPEVQDQFAHQPTPKA